MLYLVMTIMLFSIIAIPLKLIAQVYYIFIILLTLLYTPL